MAEDLTSRAPTEPAPRPQLPAPAALEEPAAAPRAAETDARQPHGVFVGRFRFAYAILAVLLGGAVGSFIVLLDRSSNTETGAAWSTWKPVTEGANRAEEIAEYVQARYRLGDGGQLVAVIADDEPTVQQLPLNYIAIQQGGDEENIKVYPAKDSIVYTLCGLGQRCAIRGGQPSQERGRLLRREALELALYTFKYVDGASSVIAYLPPRAGSTPTYALFFQKDDFKEQLERPLETTLPERPRLSPERLHPVEGAQIDQLVDDNFFQYTFQQAPDGSAVLVLQEL